MAEFAGLGAAVVGVVGLTIQITQIVYRFGLEWKHAPQAAKTFKTELDSLFTVLSETQARLVKSPEYTDAFENDNDSALLSQLGPHAPSTTALKSNLASCRTQLQDLVDQLKKLDGAHRLGWERLKRTFLSETAAKTMQQLRSQCQAFNTMSTLDNVALTARVMNETKAMRREQQGWNKSASDQHLLDWISSFEIEDKHVDVLSRRHPGTGQWLLERDEFKAWRNGHTDSPALLWLPGIPGAGKSILAAIVVEHLQGLSKQDIAVARVYCDYKSRIQQTDYNLLSSILKQFVLQLACVPESLKSLYSDRGKSDRSMSMDDVVDLLPQYTRLFRRAFIIVDALDEHLEEQSFNPEIPLLTKLKEIQSSDSTCRLLVTSRWNPIIQRQLTGSAQIEVHASSEDIAAYLWSRLYDDTKFKFAENMRKDPNLANSVVNRLVEKAQGMFLLPRLHMDLLGNQTRIRKVKDALDTLPTKLNETYENAMTRIKGQVSEHRDLALQVLSWISNAVRPLEVIELQHALGTELGDEELDDQDPEPEDLLVSVCAGLVILDGESRTIRLVHFTVEEFFAVTKEHHFPRGDEYIALTCLSYLSFGEFKNWSRDDAERKARLEKYAFYAYAGEYWATHVPNDFSPAVKKAMLSFLDDRSKVRSSCQTSLRASWEPSSRTQTSNWCYFSDPHGLHLATHFGRLDITSAILECGADPNVTDKIGRTPIVWAAFRGDLEMVRLLHDSGATLDPEPYAHTSALVSAALRDHVEVVKFLISRKADVNLRVGDWTPLLAAYRSSPNSFDALLDSGTDINEPDRLGQSILDRECNNQNTISAGLQSGRIARLLALGANVECKSSQSVGTPLIAAIRSGNKTLVDLLLAHNANPLAKDTAGRLALVTSVTNVDSRESIIQAVLHKGIEDSKAHYAEKLLLQACSVGDIQLTRIILQRDTDVKVSDRRGNTPLIAAAAQNQSGVVELLLSTGQVHADDARRIAALAVPVGLVFSIPGGYDDRRTALSIAAQQGHLDVVKTLVRHGASLDATDNYDRKAVYWAELHGNSEVVAFLRDLPTAASLVRPSDRMEEA